MKMYYQIQAEPTEKTHRQQWEDFRQEVYMRLTTRYNNGVEYGSEEVDAFLSPVLKGNDWYANWDSLTAGITQRYKGSGIRLVHIHKDEYDEDEDCIVKSTVL